MRIVIVGGGYAGMSCLMDLARRLPETQRTLVDPGEHHLQLTRLHEALNHGLDRYRIPFARLGERYGFVHRRSGPALSSKALAEARRRGCLALPEGDIPFDALVVAVGARPRPRPRHAGWSGLADLRRRDGRTVVEGMAALNRRAWVTVVGGGATGLQYLFELKDALRRAGARCRVRLVDGGERLLPGLPQAFHDYLERRIEQSGIQYLRQTRFESVDDDGLHVIDSNGRRRSLASACGLVFAGMRGNPQVLQTDASGQVLADGKILSGIFAAGDCSHYAGKGLNSASAQAAVRKGRHVAAALRRMGEGRKLPAYAARELGFFLSMGTLDGIGWMGRPRGIVTGVPAFALREALEARYELFLSGIDTFQVL
ncbi:MAG: FAD-dependent oxidoreductase [Gammaproteobacteria bacterium]